MLLALANIHIDARAKDGASCSVAWRHVVRCAWFGASLRFVSVSHDCANSRCMSCGEGCTFHEARCKCRSKATAQADGRAHASVLAQARDERGSWVLTHGGTVCSVACWQG
jgi:hypothetical protein